MRQLNAMYYLVGNEYNQAIEQLEEEGYDIGQFIPKRLDDNQALVPTVYFKDKEIKLFPLEIYAPNSPIPNRTKFDYYMNKCGDYETFKHDIVEWKEYKQEVNEMELINFDECKRYLLEHSNRRFYREDMTLDAIRDVIISSIEKSECEETIYNEENSVSEIYMITIGWSHTLSRTNEYFKVSLNLNIENGKETRKSLEFKGGC